MVLLLLLLWSGFFRSSFASIRSANKCTRFRSSYLKSLTLHWRFCFTFVTHSATELDCTWRKFCKHSNHTFGLHLQTRKHNIHPVKKRMNETKRTGGKKSTTNIPTVIIMTLNKDKYWFKQSQPNKYLKWYQLRCANKTAEEEKFCRQF